MSFTTAQQWQFFRVPVADSSFTLSDRYALTGVVQPDSPALPSSIKNQLLRYPDASDASFDSFDKFALAGYPQTVDTGSSTTDVFSLAYSVDPTWIMTIGELPISGTFVATMEAFGLSFVGVRTVLNTGTPLSRIITVAAEADREIGVEIDVRSITVDVDVNTATVDEDERTINVDTNDEVTIT